ncbi:MAG: hypothetical protein JWR67_1979 [Mucilaginibacter sp.]|nr:hypothetical protein [Mucilaginibacter sp.]
MKRTLFLFTVLVIPALALAQDRGKVEVVKDPRIDTLITRRLSLRVNSPTASSSNGYRVQIFSGSARNEAYSVQAKFQTKYPGVRTYIIYNEPNFKVRAGDFRTRLEAEKLKQELKSTFNGLFIIAEKINIPKPETGND